MDRSSSPPWSHFFSQLSLAPEWIDYYSRSFTENSMQLEMIPDLQPDYMSYLGISKLGHFMIIKKLAKELLSPLAPPPTFTRPPCNLSSSSYSLKQSDTALHINIHDKHTDNTVIIDSQQSQIKEHIIESITNITALNNLSPPSTTPNSPPSLHQDTVECIQDPVDTIPTPPRDLTSSPLTLNPHEQVVSSFQQPIDSRNSSLDRELDIQPYTETVYATTNTVCKIKSNKPVPDKKTRRKTCASSQPSFQKKRRNTKKKKPTPVTSQSIPTQLPYTLPVSIRLPIALLESIKPTEQPIELHEIPISTKSTEQPIELHEIPISTKSTEQPIELHEIPISTKSTEQPIELHEIPISTKSTEQPIELHEIPISTKSTEQPIELHEIPISTKSTEQPIELHEIPISTKSTEQPIELHEIPISTKSTEQPIELHEIPISTKSTEQSIELHEIPISTKSTEQPIELHEIPISTKSTEQPIELHEIPISTKSTEQPIELHEIPISTKSTEQPIELHEIPISTKSTEQPIELHEIPISTKSTEQPNELLESTRLPNMSHTLHSNSPIIHMSEEISCIINEDLVDTDIEQDRTLSQPHDISSPGVFVFYSQTTRPIISSSSYLTNTCTLPVNDNIIPGKSSPILSIERIDISQFTTVKNNVASMVTSSPSEFLIDLSELPDSDDGIPSQLNNSIPPKHIDTTPSVMDLPIPTTQHNAPIQINTNSIEQSIIQNVNSVLDNSQENISTDPVDLVVNTIPATTEHSVTSSPDISVIDNPDITDIAHTSTNSSPSITPLLNGLNTFSNSTNTLTNSALGKTITTSSHIKRKLTSTRRKDSKRLKTKPPSVVIRQIGHELFEDSISPVKLPPTFILPKKSNLIQAKLSDITRLSRTKKNIPINIEVSYVSDIHSQDVNHDTNIHCVDKLLDIHTSNSLPSSSKEIPVSDSEIDNIPSSPLSLHGESDKDDNALIQTHLISNPIVPNIHVLPHIQQVSRDEINPIISIPNPSETGNDISIPPDSTVIAQRVESSNTQEYLTKFAIALGENPDFFIQDKLKSNLISPRKKSKLQKKRKTKLQTVYKQKHKHKPNRLTPQKRGVRAKLRSRRVRIGVNKQIGPVMVRAVLKDKVTLPSVTSKRYVRPLPDIPFDTRGKSTSPENSDDDLVTRKQHTIAHVKKRYQNFYNTIYPQIRSEEITQPPIKGNTDYAKPQPGVQLSLKDTLIYARQERRNFACHNCLLCFETPYQLLQHSMLPKCDEIPTYYPEY